MKKYCLDTNVFINAWEKHYSMNLCPDYWKLLDDLATEGRIFCTMEVRRELSKIHDELYKWVNARPHLFKEITESAMSILREIFKDPINQRLVDSIKHRSTADPWVVVHAMAEGAVVVTNEAYQTDSAQRIRIPNVCERLNVPWINEFQFVEEVGIRFSATLIG